MFNLKHIVCTNSSGTSVSVLSVRGCWAFWKPKFPDANQGTLCQQAQVGHAASALLCRVALDVTSGVSSLRGHKIGHTSGVMRAALTWVRIQT